MKRNWADWYDRIIQIVSKKIFVKPPPPQPNKNHPVK